MSVKHISTDKSSNCSNIPVSFTNIESNVFSVNNSASFDINNGSNDNILHDVLNPDTNESLEH